MGGTIQAKPITAQVVMIVDNDHDMRDVVLDVLSERGVCAIAAEDGEDALARLATGVRPSVILLDLSMPVMDGRAFLEIKARDPAIADIPVVVMSGSDQPDDLRSDAVMRKPVSLEALLATVERFR